MSETINNDAENTSKVPTGWLLADRVEHLEQVATHLLESHKNMRKQFIELVEAVTEYNKESSEE